MMRYLVRALYGKFIYYGDILLLITVIKNTWKALDVNEVDTQWQSATVASLSLESQ